MSDVEVRLAPPEEHIRWDRLMSERHEFGFLRFVGRGLRYVAVLGTLWVGLAGWQAGAWKFGPRDRFIGWKSSQQFTRLHLVASNTRLLLLPKPGAFPNLGSCFVGGMLRRLSDDWQAKYGPSAGTGGSLGDPAQYPGTVYRASNWTSVGLSGGLFARPGRLYGPAWQAQGDARLPAAPLVGSPALCGGAASGLGGGAAIGGCDGGYAAVAAGGARAGAGFPPRPGAATQAVDGAGHLRVGAGWRARSAAMRPRASRKACRRSILLRWKRGGSASAAASSRRRGRRSTG